MNIFRQRLEKNDIDVALITDDDNVYYLTGYYDYLHMDFGRPTILVVLREGQSILITPSIDFNSAESLARVDRIVSWNDGVGNEWREELPKVAMNAMKVAIEPNHIPPVVHSYLVELIEAEKLENASSLLSDMRMIKSDMELQLARHAGEVANAMMTAGRSAIGSGIAEFEVAIATSQAGTRMAAKLLNAHYTDEDMSPNTHFLQIMASGEAITKTHHRATTRIMKYGEPVFLCFCGMTNFHRFKLGFDRTFWIGEIKDKSQEVVYEIALASHLAFLKTIEAEFAEFKGPRYHVIGNHDIDSISKEQFLANVENTGIAKDKSYYSFDSKWVHFVVLDANYLADGRDCAPGNCKWTDTHVPKKELEWLRRDLEATKLPVVVLAHQRLDGRGSHFTKNSDEVRKLLEKSGRVLVVFQGHDHRGGHSLIGGIHYYTLKAAVEGSGEENNSYGIVEVRRNGDIVVEGFRKAVDLAMPRNS